MGFAGIKATERLRLMRVKTTFCCQGCGYQSPRWLGRCPDCGRWNSLKEERMAVGPSARAAGPGATVAKPVPIEEIEVVGEHRTRSGVGEFDLRR